MICAIPKRVEAPCTSIFSWPSFDVYTDTQYLDRSGNGHGHGDYANSIGNGYGCTYEGSSRVIYRPNRQVHHFKKII